MATPATPAPVTPRPLPWWVSFTINSGIAAVHQVLHNPGYAATLKEVLIELRDAISATYPGE